MPNYALERAVMPEWLCAADAWEQCAPAALLGRHRAAAHFHR